MAGLASSSIVPRPDNRCAMNPQLAASDAQPGVQDHRTSARSELDS